MNSLTNLIAPLALILPAVAGPQTMSRQDAGLALPAGPMSRPAIPLSPVFLPAEAQQVRIEEHVTIRISPRAAPMPLMPPAFARSFDGSDDLPRYIERKVGKCVSIQGIAGVQPGERNRLLLIMRDQRVISAALSKACQSRAYYSGFLVAKNTDGLICQGRDQLLARNGATCQVSSFRQLVEAGN